MKIINKMNRKQKLFLAWYLVWVVVHYILFICGGPYYDYGDGYNDSLRPIFWSDGVLNGDYDILDFIFCVFTPIMIYVIVKLFKSASKDKKKKRSIDIEDIDDDEDL